MNENMPVNTQSSGANAEKELSRVKQKLAQKEFIDTHTVSGWDAIKTNFRWCVAMSLLLAMSLDTDIKNINHQRFYNEHVISSFLLFCFVIFNLKRIRKKLEFFIYFNEGDRISRSFYSSIHAKGVFSPEEVIGRLRAEDAKSIKAISASVALFSGIAMLSVLGLVFASIQAYIAIYAGKYFHGDLTRDLSLWVYCIIGAHVWICGILSALFIYLSFKFSSDFERLAKSLRVENDEKPIWAGGPFSSWSVMGRSIIDLFS